MATLDLPTEKILAHSDGFVGHIVLNNPERHNAVSLEMWDAVEIALSAFATDDAVRVVMSALAAEACAESPTVAE